MDNLEHILAIELMNAHKASTSAARRKPLPFLSVSSMPIGKKCPFVKDDIVMYKEIHKTVAFLKRTQIEY